MKILKFKEKEENLDDKIRIKELEIRIKEIEIDILNSDDADEKESFKQDINVLKDRIQDIKEAM